MQPETDIVDRLQTWLTEPNNLSSRGSQLLIDARDEIIRLRAEIDDASADWREMSERNGR